MCVRAVIIIIIIIYLVFDLDRDLHRVLDRFLYRVLTRVLAHFDPAFFGKSVVFIRSINSLLVSSSGPSETLPVF